MRVIYVFQERKEKMKLNHYIINIIGYFTNLRNTEKYN